MTDFFVKYSGTPANDSGLTSQGLSNGTVASGQDHTMQNIAQKRVGVTFVCGLNTASPLIIYVQPKIGANYGADSSAYHRLSVYPISNTTVYQEFILLASDAPKDFRFNVENNTGSTVTVTVETEDAVISDTP